MKKGLLLSVVATGFIFAGGDIAPVAPVEPQPAVAPAACNFWGTIGARYEFFDHDMPGTENDYDFGDKENNTWKATVVLGVEKEIGYGFGIGAEVAATNQLGLTDIAARYDDDAELSQLYLTYKTGNTLIKAGRQALPKTLSPWAWSDRTVNRIDTSFEGVVVVNTDLADTTLVGAWIARAGDKEDFVKVNGEDDKGLFMLAVENKSLANTTLRSSLYYITEAKIFSGWASAETKFNNVDLGLQVAYAKPDEGDDTIGVAGRIGTTYNNLDLALTAAYINDGDVTLNLGGTSGFWGNSFEGAFGGDISKGGGKQTIVRLDGGYDLGNYGKIYGGVGYDKFSDDATYDKAYGGRLGYKFKIADVNAKVEYRYRKFEGNNDADTWKEQRIRVEGIYKF